MPAIVSGKILVTGASGFIGAWIVKLLLERNYDVLVALRSQSQADFILQRYPGLSERISSVIVPDITLTGAYNSAVVGVDAVIHCASPVVVSWEDPSELIDPAVKGASEILESALKFGTKVKRIIITSTTGAVYQNPKPSEKQHDETEWNKLSFGIVQKRGKASGHLAVYCTSKTLAEATAWKFMAERKPIFELTTILPSWVFGPYLHEVPKEKGPGSSLGLFLSTLSGNGIDTSGDFAGDWVDVRDTALMHILALETPQAGGERIISCNTAFAWQDIYDVLNDASPEFINNTKIPIPGKDTRGGGKAATSIPLSTNAKSLALFGGASEEEEAGGSGGGGGGGFKYRSLEESVLDMARDLVAGGFI